MRFTRSVLRRGPAVLGAAVAVTAATVAVPLPLHAQPAGPTSPAATPTTTATSRVAPPALDGVGSGPHTVTLVTGDRITVTDTGDGLKLDTKAATRADGSTPLVFQQTDQNGVYAIPADARAAIAAGLLDRELFNVEYLVENGYADAESTQIPVIVQYPRSRSTAAVASAAQALPASAPTASLSSIHGAGLAVAKAQAGSFWQSLIGATPSARVAGAATALGGGVGRVWLDRRVTADLAESVPLIGAPQAWAAGHDGTGVTVAVLDTGIDTAHPDLAGKVAASRSFIPGVDSIQDGHGHGTHVALMIVGSGAASGGKYKGVAPGARLMVGKVLGDDGSGSVSGAIEGMQWAASNGADIVSMSIGAGVTDGSDAFSQAVDDLTAETGTLFVIAAGNDGRGGDRTVNSPGTADAALTVAATDKADGLADFSSRGPRALDSALKPDIAAPGVGIVAARAAGTTMGSPVDDRYTMADGTSMATPHVAGAAAILAQSHPDWTPAQLKAALMSTATDAGHTAYQQGAGRVDVARADAQRVYATTPNADFGSIEDGAATLTRQVTYANLTDQPVTLTLTAALRRLGSDPADVDIHTDATVTVPAGGTATTAVTVDATDLGHGVYAGSVVAADATGAVRLRTPVGLVREPPAHTVTIHTVNADGVPAGQVLNEALGVPTFIDVAGARGAVDVPMNLVGPGTIRARLPEGTYSVSQDFTWIDSGYRANYAMMLEPQVTVDRDLEITFDPRNAKEVSFQTPLPSEANPYQNIGWTLARASADTGVAPIVLLPTNMPPSMRLFVTPTQPVTMGQLTFQPTYALTRPALTMSVRRPRSVPLHPVLDRESGAVPFPAGAHTLSLVDGRSGRAEQLAGMDLRGRLVLLDDDPEDGNHCSINSSVLQRVKDAGATGVVAFPAGPLGGCKMNTRIPLSASGPPTLPYVTVAPAEGGSLRDQLGSGPVTVTVTSNVGSPYVYSLAPLEEGRIPDSLHYRFGDRDLATFDLTLHSAAPQLFTFWFQAEKAGVSTSPLTAAPPPMLGPGTLRQYVGPLVPDVRYKRGYTTTGGAVWTKNDVLDRPVRAVEHYNADPITPGASQNSTPVRALTPPGQRFPGFTLGFCSVCRQGDVLWANVDQKRGPGNDAGIKTDTVTHLYGPDGQEIALTRPGQAALPAAETWYRLTAQTAATSAEWRFRSATATANTTPAGVWCRGSHPAWGGSTTPCRPEPLVYVATDLGPSLAADNTAVAGRNHTFRVVAHHSTSTAPMPRIAGMKVWTSTDDGTQWTAAKVKADRDGVFSVTARYPSYLDSTGAVSLRVEAWDVDGNTVTQTTSRAFGLRDNRPAFPTRAA